MKKKSIILSVLFLAIISLGYSQAPGTLWSQTFGGTGYDYGYSVLPTSDGGYIISGSTTTYGAGNADIYLIKTDVNGNTLWSQTFGGSASEEGFSIQQTTDGGYIIAGHTYSYGAGSADVYLVKTDADGNESWSQTFGGSANDKGKNVQQTSDGGYIITGITESYGNGNTDAFLIKTDADGNEIWFQTFGGADYDYGYDAKQTIDGGFIIIGITNSYGAGYTDVYLIKTDADGNESWSQVFGGANTDNGYSIQQTLDGGYIIAGDTSSYGVGDNDVYLIKTDVDGNELWYKTFGGNKSDRGFSVQQTIDGGYIIVGYSFSFTLFYSEVYLIKIDADGNESWYQTYGDEDGEDAGFDVKQTSDGGYIIAGWTFSFGAGASDVWLIKTDSDTADIEDNSESNIHISVYPNPTSDFINITTDFEQNQDEITINIFDVTSKIIYNSTIKSITNNSFNIDISNLENGIYSLKFVTNDKNYFTKIIKQ